jgi:hypothetical protein
MREFVVTKAAFSLIPLQGQGKMLLDYCWEGSLGGKEKIWVFTQEAEDMTHTRYSHAWPFAGAGVMLGIHGTSSSHAGGIPHLHAGFETGK